MHGLENVFSIDLGLVETDLSSSLFVFLFSSFFLYFIFFFFLINQRFELILFLLFYLNIVLIRHVIVTIESDRKVIAA